MSAPRRAPRRHIDGVLLFDKPAGPSSNQALQIARRLFNAEKAGHTGTLDPFATGLLPLCLGEATKFSADLLEADKQYMATARLGIETDSGDSEGVVVQRCDRPIQIDHDDVERVLASFRGEIEQVPPMHSALKRDGRPLYELARQGIDVPRSARRVCVRALNVVGLDGDMLTLAVHCSKGTYVRTLAQDIGRALGCGAHLTALRRTAIGPLHIDRAVTLATLESLDMAARDALLLPADQLVASLMSISLEADAAGRILHGQAVDGAFPDGVRVRLYGPHARFLGIGRAHGGRIQPMRLLAAPAGTSPEQGEKNAVKA